MTNTTDTAQVAHALRSYAKREWGFGSHVPHLMDEAADALERIAAENADLRKDAERYRWWRSKQQGWSPRMDGTFAYTAGHLHVRGRTFDEAIDAAMAQGNGYDV